MCGLVLRSQACKELIVSHGTLFAEMQRNDKKLRSVCISSGWLDGALPTLLHMYYGQKLLLARADPKQLVPHKTCAQQAASLMVGTESCLCLLTFLLLSFLDRPSEVTQTALAVMWLHGSWFIFDSA